ncbi:MAG: hypothetical protein ABFC94_13550 [Syntrophomonas sp.]
MKEIITPTNFKISTHALERFLERIVKHPVNYENCSIARLVIKSQLSYRACPITGQNGNVVEFSYKNGLFIYQRETNTIITVMENPRQSNEVISWKLHLPVGTHFQHDIPSKEKIKMITKGFVPVGIQVPIVVGATFAFNYQTKWVFKKDQEVIDNESRQQKKPEAEVDKSSKFETEQCS